MGDKPITPARFLTSPEDAAAEFLAAGVRISPVDYCGVARPCPGVCLRCGSAVQPTLRNIRSGQGPCKTCGRERTTLARRIPFEEAEIIFLRLGVHIARSTYQGTGKRAPGICLGCGHPTAPTLGHLEQGKFSCKRCADSARGEREAISWEEAEKRFLAVGALIDPATYKHSKSRCSGTCMTCGGSIAVTLNNARNSNGCRPCAIEQRRYLRTPSIEEVQALFLGLDIEIDPDSFTFATERCKGTCLRCGEGVEPMYTMAKYRGVRSCWTCGPTDRMAAQSEAWDGPGAVYLVESEDGRVRKVGVMAQRSNRLELHARQGLPNLIEWVDTPSVAQAFTIEARAKRHLRSLGAKPAWSNVDMRYAGATETFWTSDAPGLSLHDYT